MSDARSGKPKALGRGLDDIVTPPAADVDATESLLKRVQPRHVRPTPPTPRTPPTDATHPIAPERDFVRVPNSVARDVVPAGHFVGKSKQLYDCLFQRTRGAIVPTRRLAISKPELMRVSGIGSERTLLKNLGHLRDLSLVRVTYTDGRHEGNTYEVFTPEEAGLRTPRTPPTPRHARAEVPSVPPAESGVRDVGSEPLDSSTSEIPNTSIKTNTKDDDDVMPLLRSRVGKPMPKTEAVLLSLLDTLEARTDVSSPDSLLAHVLTQKLSPRGKSAQRRPSEGQFRDRPVEIEVTDEDLAEYERNRAELSKSEQGD